MREHRAAATTAGILYIVGAIAGVLSKVVAIAPVSGADDPFAASVQRSGAVVTCALLVLVMRSVPISNDLTVATRSASASPQTSPSAV